MQQPKCKTAILACGALAREITDLIKTPGWEHLELVCLPATLHNRPELIAGEVEAQLRSLATKFDQIFVAYADCGTGGLLDAVLERYGVERMPGAHCYANFAGQSTFAQISDDEPGSFYVTDFLVRQFDTLVVKSLGLDKHPELRDAYFGHYRRLVYLVQNPNIELDRKAEGAAEFLGLEYLRLETGLSELAVFVQSAARESENGTKNHRLLEGYSSTSDHQSRATDGQEATRRALRASYRPRRDARKTHRNRRLS